MQMWKLVQVQQNESANVLFGQTDRHVVFIKTAAIIFDDHSQQRYALKPQASMKYSVFLKKIITL